MPLELVSEAVKVGRLRNIILQRPPTEAGDVGFVSIAVIITARIMSVNTSAVSRVKDAKVIIRSSGDDLEGVCIYPLIWVYVRNDIVTLVGAIGSSHSFD